MAKWQKNLAVFAAGCLLTGAVTIGIGAIAGGVQDVKDIYMAPIPAPKKTKKEYANVTSLDLDFQATIVKVEVADVDKVTVIRTVNDKKIFDYTGKLKTSVTDGVLKMKNEADLSRDKKPDVDTEILGVFSYFRKDNGRWTTPIVIQIPRDLVLKEVNIRLRGGNGLAFVDTKMQKLTLQAERSDAVGVENVRIDQVEVPMGGSLHISKSHIKKGQMNSEGYLGVEESKLENLSISATSATDIHFTENILKDSQIHAEAGYFNLSGMTYLGKIDVGNKNGSILMEQLSNMDLLDLDLTAEPGNIRLDVNDLPYTEIMDEKKSTYQHKGSQVRSEITIKVQNGAIELIDWAEDDLHRPEWMKDEAPDFKRFE